MCHVPGVGGRLAWPQLFDAACVDLCQGFAHAPAGDYALGRDLRKRDQHERTFEQTRMWQREISPVEDEVIIGQEIDIEQPRSPPALARAVAPEGSLDRLRAREQCLRG